MVGENFSIHATFVCFRGSVTKLGILIFLILVLGFVWVEAPLNQHQ